MFRFLQKVFYIYLFLSRYFVIVFLKLKVENYGEPPFPFRVDSLQCKKHITPERNIVIVFTILYERIISAHTAKPTAKTTNPQLFRPSRCRLCP